MLIVSDVEVELDSFDVINQEVTLSVNGAVVAQGRGGNVLGDPVRSLHWLANDMAKRGEDFFSQGSW